MTEMMVEKRNDNDKDNENDYRDDSKNIQQSITNNTTLPTHFHSSKTHPLTNNSFILVDQTTIH